MKIVHADEVAWQRGLEHRGGVFHSRRLLEGEPGRIDNFQFTMGRMEGDFYSPRHRHNFEQIRFQLVDELNFDRDGKLSAGMAGYFPEGVFYGPQSQDPGKHPSAVVLQFGGASGSGYLSRNEVKAGMDRLSQEGEFRNGVFRRHGDAEGKRNMDGYQAIWEHAHGHPMVYPEPRYSRPFMMNPDAYDWVPVEGQPGVSEKLLGVFTERRSLVRLVQAEAGASVALSGRSIHFVRSGEGQVAGQAYRQFTAIFLEAGEQARLVATGPTDLLHLGLPDLSGMMAARLQLSAAAE